MRSYSAMAGPAPPLNTSSAGALNFNDFSAGASGEPCDSETPTVFDPSSDSEMISEVLGGIKQAHELVGSVSGDEDFELALNLPKKLAPEINIEGDLVLPSSSTNQGKKAHKRVIPLHGGGGDGASDQEIVSSGRRKHVSPVMNATVISQGKGNTILIKPTGPNAASFLKNPVKLAQGIRESAYGKFLNIKVRTNPRRNLMATEFEDISAADLKALLQVTRIGNWTVKCSQPGTDKSVIGVIGPIHLSVDITELQESAQSGSTKILQMTRMPRIHLGIRKESAAVKVTFEGLKLPEAVYIDFLRFPVRPFVFSPLRCYKCQQLGHVASGCTEEMRCLLCAGPHDRAECPNSSGSFRHCANCGGPHSASSRECDFIVSARAVEKLRASGLTYADAAKKVKKLTSVKAVSGHGNNFPVPTSIHGAPQTTPQTFSSHIQRQSSHRPRMTGVEVTAQVHSSQGSYFPSQPTTQVPQPAAQKPSSELNSSSSQPMVEEFNEQRETLTVPGITPSTSEFRAILREELIVSESRMETLISSTLREFSMKVGRILHDAFSLNLVKEGQKERALLLVSLLRNNFGQSIGDDLLNEWLPAFPANQVHSSVTQPGSQPDSSLPSVDAAAPLGDPLRSNPIIPAQACDPNKKKRQQATVGLSKRTSGRGQIKKSSK